MKGLISTTMDWIFHPANSDGKVSDWAAFVTVALIAAFLWKHVIDEIA